MTLTGAVKVDAAVALVLMILVIVRVLYVWMRGGNNDLYGTTALAILCASLIVAVSMVKVSDEIIKATERIMKK